MGIILGTNLKYITFSWKNASNATKSITCVMVLIAWALNNEPLDLTLLAKCQQEVQTIWDWLIIFNPRTLLLERKKNNFTLWYVIWRTCPYIHSDKKKYKTVSLIKPGIWLENVPLDWSKRKKEKKRKNKTQQRAEQKRPQANQQVTYSKVRTSESLYLLHLRCSAASVELQLSYPSNQKTRWRRDALYRWLCVNKVFCFTFMSN